jgi:hypothetical protein
MFVRINGKSYLLTAGHALEAIDDARKQKIQIRENTVFTTNGTEAIPFMDHLEETPLYYLNKKDSIDIGLILLSLWYENQIKSETFITEAYYSNLPSNYTGCILIGFPSAYERFEPNYVNLNPAYVLVRRTWRPSDLPQPKPTRFFGKINVTADFDVKGMSGGPIMGFLHDPKNDELRYWIVALQSGWYRNRQLICGTMLETGIPILMRHFGLD